MPTKDKALRSKHNRAYYEKNKPRYRKLAKESLARALAVIRKLKEAPCTDCHTQFPYYVMDFDHKGEKLGNISTLIRRIGLAKVLAEVKKCDLVCSNCHRIRGHKRRVGELT